MKLSADQIKQIEEKLYVDYEFYYDDTKYEVLDHIASEIEEEMQTESFEVSFYKVFENWHNRLKGVEWSGMHLYGKIKIPLFYKNKLQSTFRDDLFIWIIISLFVPGLIYFFKDAMEIETINSIVFTHKIVVSSLTIFLNIYTYKKYIKGKYTTVYGQIAAYANKKNILPICILSIIFINQNIQYKENIELWLGALVFFNAFYFMFIIKHYNYFRHLKMVKNIINWKNA